MKKYLVIMTILFFSLILYGFRLNKVPVHLNQDELEFSLNAYSIADNLSDPSGRFMPFYFWHLDSFWATPVIVYLTSITLKAFPIAESSVRLSSVLVGLFDIFIFYLLVLKIFNKRFLALIGALMLVTTPVHFIHSRLLLDNLYTVPFVLLWLYFLKTYVDSSNLLYLFSAALSLGIGLHSYHAGKIVMPIYFLAMAVFLFLQKTKKQKLLLGLTGFFIPIVTFIPWLIKYPDTLLNQVSYIASLDKTVEAGQGIWGVFTFSRLSDFISNYFSYFDPEILFTQGDRSLVHSTGQVGAFLFPVIFLLVFGVLQVLFKEKDKFSRLVLFGFFTYPVASAIVNDPQRISRSLVVIPFVLLLSVYGIKLLLNSKDKALKYLLPALLIVGLFQFGGFLTDYFGNYRERSYKWFNGNINGAMESVVISAKIRDVGNIYLDEHIPFVDRYFRFVALQEKVNLENKWSFYDYKLDSFSDLPEKSLVVVASSHGVGISDNVVGEFERVEIIREPDGNESFYLYYRDSVE